MRAQYRIDARGMREFMTSQMLGSAMRQVAAQVAGQANSTGRSRYEVRELTVTGGWRNTSRAGAEAYEAERPSWRDVNNRHLVNVAAGFRMRGGG